jgi:hypothetical protein
LPAYGSVSIWSFSSLVELSSIFFVNESNRESICEDPAQDNDQKPTNTELMVLDEPDSMASDWSQRSCNQWNKITSCTIDNQTVLIDRTTWIIKNGFSFQYQIDSLGYPINPMGRTGARGRGALFRWGPNHEIRNPMTRRIFPYREKLNFLLPKE